MTVLTEWCDSSRIYIGGNNPIKFLPGEKRNTKAQDENVFFNHRESRRLLKVICCLDFFKGSKFAQALNKIYIAFVFTLLLSVVVQGLAMGYMAKYTSVKVEAVNYTLVIVIVIAYIVNELYNYSSLDRAWALLIYTYKNFNGPDISEQQKQVHRDNAKMVQNWNNVFSGLMCGASIAYLSFAPIREAILAEPDAPRSLPIPMYMPFEASYNPGYATAIIWEGISLIFLCVIATSAHQSYLSYMGALRAELELLNYSVSCLEKRAAKMSDVSEVTLDSYKDQHFQNCLYSCLREDIIHHQLLLQYYKLTKEYLGFILLIYIVVASIILAAAGYLITRPNSPMDKTIKFVIIVCSELWFIFCLCWFGEKVSEESNKTFQMLYNGPWYLCNKKFTINLSIILCGTLSPIRLKTNLFSITASLETYNSVVTSSFQYFNVLRNIQTL